MQEFERYEAAQPGVLGFVHFTRPPTAELLDDAVMGNRCADHGLYRRVYPARVRMAGRSHLYILFSENLGGKL